MSIIVLKIQMYTSLLTLLLVGTVSCLERGNVPGLGFLGSSFSLFNPEKTSRVQVLNLDSFDMNMSTPDLRYRVPDGVLFSSNSKCYLSPSTKVANNVRDF